MKVSVFWDILCGQSSSLCLDQRTTVTIFQGEGRNEQKMSPGNRHTLQLAYTQLLDAARAEASRIQASGSVPEKPVNGSQKLTYRKQKKK